MTLGHGELRYVVAGDLPACVCYDAVSQGCELTGCGSLVFSDGWLGTKTIS